MAISSIYPQIIHTNEQSIIKLNNKTATLCETNTLFTTYTDTNGEVVGLSIYYEDTREENILQLVQNITLTLNMGHLGLSINTSVPSDMSTRLELYNKAHKIVKD